MYKSSGTLDHEYNQLPENTPYYKRLIESLEHINENNYNWDQPLRILVAVSDEVYFTMDNPYKSRTEVLFSNTNEKFIFNPDVLTRTLYPKIVDQIIDHITKLTRTDLNDNRTVQEVLTDNGFLVR